MLDLFGFAELQAAHQSSGGSGAVDFRVGGLGVLGFRVLGFRVLGFSGSFGLSGLFSRFKVREYEA